MYLLEREKYEENTINLKCNKLMLINGDGCIHSQGYANQQLMRQKWKVLKLKKKVVKKKDIALERWIWARLSYLYCWWSLVLLVFAMNLSANFSRFREYSVSISAFFRKKSCRSCRSWTRISVCCSRHFCCSTSWARISKERRESTGWFHENYWGVLVCARAQPRVLLYISSVLDLYETAVSGLAL